MAKQHQPHGPPMTLGNTREGSLPTDLKGHRRL